MQIHSDGETIWGVMTVHARSNSKGEIVPSDMWNDALPVEEGYYWTLPDPPFSANLYAPTIVHVFRESEHKPGNAQCELKARWRGHVLPLSCFYHWLGPLPVPEPPKGA